MSRNGSGTYTLPVGNPVTTGTTITSSWANNTLTDIANALTGSVASDGQTPITGNFQMGGNRIVNMGDGLVSTDGATLGQITTTLASYQALITAVGLLKGAGAGSISAAVAGTDYAGITNVQTFTAGQRGGVSALTSASTITPDFAVSNNFSLTLDTNATLANPSNLVAGQSGIIVITQDATGSRTLAYGSYFKFPSGTAPTLTTTANAVDVLFYYVQSSTKVDATLLNNFS